jgi:hypothetical protein
MRRNRSGRPPQGRRDLASIKDASASHQVLGREDARSCESWGLEKAALRFRSKRETTYEATNAPTARASPSHQPKSNPTRTTHPTPKPQTQRLATAFTRSGAPRNRSRIATKLRTARGSFRNAGPGGGPMPRSCCSGRRARFLVPTELGRAGDGERPVAIPCQVERCR